MLIELLHCQYYKKVLNSNGHQFHKYQQHEQSSLILIELTEHTKKQKYVIRNPGPWLGTGTKNRRC